MSTVLCFRGCEGKNSEHIVKGGGAALISSFPSPRYKSPRDFGCASRAGAEMAYQDKLNDPRVKGAKKLKILLPIDDKFRFRGL